MKESSLRLSLADDAGTETFEVGYESPFQFSRDYDKRQEIEDLFRWLW
ncbi:MAG: hypothetical protein OEM01_05370 [Desulfobulbaceae bacterium]|nr:hypothetical protein [Desulfobulbaceae bacterium]